jgi:hypothetical protein
MEGISFLLVLRTRYLIVNESWWVVYIPEGHTTGFNPEIKGIDFLEF